MNRIKADNYFSIIPEWVLYADVSAVAVRLYGVLQRHADKDSGRCHPSRKRLAALCRTTTRTIDRAAKELIDIGAISVAHRKSNTGDQTSNEYTVITAFVGVTESALPLDKKDTRGGDKNDTRTIVSVNQSQELTDAAKRIADGWWSDYKTRTGGKVPTGKSAWHSLMNVVSGALKAGWPERAVQSAMRACDTVPTTQRLERLLLTIQQPNQPAVKKAQRHDPQCAECDGVGFITSEDADGNRYAKPCVR